MPQGALASGRAVDTSYMCQVRSLQLCHVKTKTAEKDYHREQLTLLPLMKLLGWGSCRGAVQAARTTWTKTHIVYSLIQLTQFHQSL